MISSIFDVGSLEEIPLSIQFSSSLASRVTKEIDTSRPLIRYRPWVFRMMVLSSRICGSRSQICPISRSIISLERKPAKASYLWSNNKNHDSEISIAAIFTTHSQGPSQKKTSGPSLGIMKLQKIQGSTDEENRCSLQAKLLRWKSSPNFWGFTCPLLHGLWNRFPKKDWSIRKIDHVWMIIPKHIY